MSGGLFSVKLCEEQLQSRGERLRHGRLQLAFELFEIRVSKWHFALFSALGLYVGTLLPLPGETGQRHIAEVTAVKYGGGTVVEMSGAHLHMAPAPGRKSEATVLTLNLKSGRESGQ